MREYNAARPHSTTLLWQNKLLDAMSMTEQKMIAVSLHHPQKLDRAIGHMLSDRSRSFISLRSNKHREHDRRALIRSHHI
jgi:hypothetical protein